MKMGEKMKQESLKKFENKKITIFLRNSLKYTNIHFKFIDNMIRFFDTREGEFIFLEPEDVLAIAIKKSEVENGGD